MSVYRDADSQFTVIVCSILSECVVSLYDARGQKFGSRDFSDEFTAHRFVVQDLPGRFEEVRHE